MKHQQSEMMISQMLPMQWFSAKHNWIQNYLQDEGGRGWLIICLTWRGSDDLHGCLEMLRCYWEGWSGIKRLIGWKPGTQWVSINRYERQVPMPISFVTERDKNLNIRESWSQNMINQPHSTPIKTTNKNQNSEIINQGCFEGKCQVKRGHMPSNIFWTSCGHKMMIDTTEEVNDKEWNDVLKMVFTATFCLIKHLLRLDQVWWKLRKCFCELAPYFEDMLTYFLDSHHHLYVLWFC